LRQFRIPIPDTSAQDEIVAQIEDEQTLVQTTQKLIYVFEQKIKDCIAKVWGE